jgi:prolyl-tRNA synthetase
MSCIKELTQKNVTVLYDDRDEARAGEKFADADLIGFPYRVVISDKTLSSGTLK